MTTDTPASRRSLRAITRAVLAVLAVAALAWTLWLLAFGGGFIISLAGLRIRSNNPQRTFIFALIALAGFLLAGGRIPIVRLAARLRAAIVGLARRPTWVACLLAVASAVAAFAGSTCIAGGSDAYGYVSQADLWRRGDLKIDQRWASEAPWPDARWTFTPLGYRPAVRDDRSIVPTYAPGLPMLMAVAKAIAGQCAMFAVGPILSGLAVLATYGLGCRLKSRTAGVGAAWLVATSPVVLGALDPLSDVPVMAAWTIALYYLLGTSLSAAAVSGLFAGLAILIRPNLFPLAAPMGAWFLLRASAPTNVGRGVQTPPLTGRFVAASVFAIGVLLGIGAEAAINHYLYGSPAMSGYGRLTDQFAWHRVVPNLRRYVSWLAEIQTPIALAGFIPVYWPAKRLWPDVPDRRVFIVFGAFIAILWGMYAAYLEFDSWGYLRFVLPGFPLIMLGVASMFVAAGRVDRPGVRWAAGLAVAALGAWTLAFAVFDITVYGARQAARHEAPLGRLLRAYTPEKSVVLAYERSGSMRYYGGRMTLRYDLLDPQWLDRAVEWFAARGVRVYAVLDARQAGDVRQRFASQKRAAVFEHPFLTYEPAGTSLYDVSGPIDPTRPIVVIPRTAADRPGCDPPVELRPPF